MEWGCVNRLSSELTLRRDKGDSPQLSRTSTRLNMKIMTIRTSARVAKFAILCLPKFLTDYSDKS